MKNVLKQNVLEEIKNTLQKFTSKNLYQCPCCDAIFEWEDTSYNPEERTYTCNKCMSSFDECDLQAVTLVDYIEDLFIKYKGEKK